MTGVWRHSLVIARKDLRIEYRTGEALLVIAPFGAVAMWVIPFAVGTDTPLLRELGSGVYWAVVTLFGMFVTLRQSAVDPAPQMSVLTLAGVPGPARLTGGALANALLLVAFEVVLAPVAVALYDPVLSGWVWLILVLPLVAAGLAMLGAIADALLRALSTRVTLGPLLTVPLTIPLLLGATQSVEASKGGGSPVPWVLLLVLVDLILFLALIFAGRFLEEF